MLDLVRKNVRVRRIYRTIENWAYDVSLCTGWSKKTDPQFYFWDNFGNSSPILTILLLLQAEIYAA